MASLGKKKYFACLKNFSLYIICIFGMYDIDENK